MFLGIDNFGLFPSDLRKKGKCLHFVSETPGVQRKKLIATMHHLLFDTNPDIVVLSK